MVQKTSFLRLSVILCCFLASMIVQAQESLIPQGDKILVWIGQGDAPGDQPNSQPGELAFVDAGDAIETVMPLPEGATFVVPCGDDATSDDGRYFTFFVGGEVGTLYLMDGVQAPLPVAENLFAMACTGQGTFRYSPDGKRLAYLDFPLAVTSNIYAEGTLNVASTSDLTDRVAFDEVTAFDLHNETVAFIGLFPNSQGQAVEAAINTWSGDTDREIATLTADSGCQYNSAQVRFVSAEKLAVVMGHRCSAGDTRTHWQLYTVDITTRSATLALSAPLVGTHRVAGRTNSVWVSGDGGAVAFTTPDGVTTFTTGIVVAPLDSLTPMDVIGRDAVMARYTNRPTYGSENHPPVQSADGNWVALVQNDPNNQATFTMIDFAAPDLPILFTAGERGNIISEILITPDSKQAIFVAGGHSGSNNSLFGIELTTGNDTRIRRGRYGHGVMSPDGDKVALMSWQAINDVPAYMELLIVDLPSTAETAVFVGGQVVDNRVENQQFIYPLSWRRGSSQE